MKITNIHNLPSPLVEAVRQDSYSRGDSKYSVSDLWAPARQVRLVRQHDADLSRDVMDSLWSIFGRSVHSILDKFASEGVVNEHRLFYELDGVKLSGQFDRLIYANNTLQDYKVTSASSLVFDSRSKEWAAKMNTYRWLLAKNGLQVDNLQAVAILRDWSKRESKRNKDYPLYPVVVLDLPVWDLSLTEQEVRKRLADLESPTLPLCSDEERWIRETVWAVMKQDRKSAVKLFDRESDAVDFISMSPEGKKLYVQERPARAIRCEEYCDVSRVCEQWKNDPRNVET